MKPMCLCFLTQGRVFFSALVYVKETLSSLYAFSYDGAAPGGGLKLAPTELQAGQPPPTSSSAGSLPPSELQAGQPPPTSSAGSLPPSELQAGQPPPASSAGGLLMEAALHCSSGKGWADHLRNMWEANCSCRAAGYPESSLEEFNQTWGDGSACSGLPSPMDVPTMSQAAARESAVEVLRALRQLAGRVWPDHPAAAVSRGDGRCDPASYADWEMLQAELLSSFPPSELLSSSPSEVAPGHSNFSWGEALWCFNPGCTNLSGPSELALKTQACGGGCGVRYCRPECQAQGWRDGHRLSCGRLRDRRVAAVAQEVQERGGGARASG